MYYNVIYIYTYISAVFGELPLMPQSWQLPNKHKRKTMAPTKPANMAVEGT
jgi:hypothetical protein